MDCIETDDLMYNIANEISRAKPIGIGMVKSGVSNLEAIEVPIEYGYNNHLEQTISFYKAKRTAIIVDITYSFGNYTGDNIVEDINTAIEEYIGTVGVGGTVYGTMLANYVITKLNIGIGTVYLNKSGDSTPSDSTVEMMGYETPFTDNNHITATQIK